MVFLLMNFSRLKSENTSLSIALAKAEERAINLALERDKADRQLQEERARSAHQMTGANQELLIEKNRIAKSEEQLIAQRQRFAEQEIAIREIQQKFQLEFQNVANKLLDEKSKTFIETNRTNLDILLNPLKENIKAFEDKVDKVYNMEAAERNTLKGVITQLMDLNKMISNEAQNLTKALKGDSKKQGNWGEVILERVLERSGLVKKFFFFFFSPPDLDGNRLQPDAIIDLPDEKHLIIDSKASLIAYERLGKLRNRRRAQTIFKSACGIHPRTCFKPVLQNYHDLYQVNSPRFCVAFCTNRIALQFCRAN